MTTEKINAIIIDDERHCIESLKSLINKHCSQIQLTHCCHSAKEGLLSIRKSKPDLVFLDVEMPWMSGIELLEALGTIDFQVIFTTAHDQYAVQAFRLSAIDYLLKPIQVEDLKESVERVSNYRYQNIQERFEHLSHNMNNSQGLHRVGIPTKEGIDYILIDEIIYCEAESNYAHVYLKNKRHIMMSKPLKEIESQLKPYNFCRIHQSYLINLNHLVKYVRGNAGYVIMANEQHLNVSRAKKHELMNRINSV